LSWSQVLGFTMMPDQARKNQLEMERIGLRQGVSSAGIGAPGAYTAGGGGGPSNIMAQPQWGQGGGTGQAPPQVVDVALGEQELALYEKLETRHTEILTSSREQQRQIDEYYGWLRFEQEQKNNDMTLADTGRINQLKTQSTQMAADNMIKTGKLLLASSMQGNKALFDVVKAASIGQAMMGTYTGAAKALAEVPYPFNFVAAASVIAFGLAQVAQISSQSMSSTGGGASAGVPAVSPTTAMPVADVGAPATSLSESKPSTTIYIEGDFLNDKEALEKWAEKISELVEDHSVTLVSSVSREVMA